MTWQRKARGVIAVFGLAVAAVVYLTMGERATQAPAPPPARMDPTAIIESSGAALQQDREAALDFEVTSDRQLYYEDGASRLVGVRITVRGRAGRDFVLTGREASATGNEEDLQLSGDVTMQASDGFELHADEATFNQSDSLVRAPGLVTFAKGGLTGSGMGMSYDEARDVLSLLDEARLSVAGDEQNDALALTADAATLRRSEGLLGLDGQVHVVRGAQVIDADRAVAHLTDEDIVTLLALRGNAQVSGGSGLDGMLARDIDLDYADDGRTLERVILDGTASVALPAREDAPGRHLSGERLDLSLAPDGSLLRADGTGGVDFEAPAVQGSPSRRVTAKTLEAVGEAEVGLTSAHFQDDVQYREGRGRTSAERAARSESLTIEFDGDTVRRAVFSGRVTFREEELVARAADARYDPVAGTLRLVGPTDDGPPRVSDDRIEVLAEAIDVTLDGRQLEAARNVKTTMKPERTRGAATAATEGSVLPGLLKDDQSAFVNAGALEYHGSSGSAIYTGNASLWQGDTAIRADRITIDQKTGDLVATGSARSTLSLEGELSTGRAAEIRYIEGARTITYLGSPNVAAGQAATGTARGPGVRESNQADALARMTGPQGDLRARQIEVLLREGFGGADRLDAQGEVTALVDRRIATGATLTYIEAQGSYTMSGAPGVPVTVVDSCRTTTGRTLVFFKTTDRIIVDGNDQGRTQTTSTGSCASPGAAR